MDFLKSNVPFPDLGELSSATVTKLGSLIKSDPLLLKNATEMFTQAGSKQNLGSFLSNLSKLTRTAPTYNADAKGTSGGSLGILTNLIEPYVKTPAGQAFFQNEQVDQAFQAILKDWTVYLQSPESANVLNDQPGGWFSSEALSDERLKDFEDDFECNIKTDHWGFKSFDDFFTRRLRDGRRPVADPEDDTIIVSPCDATKFLIQNDIQSNDTFDIKSQQYSLSKMLDGDERANDFIGGTIYQAYLGPMNYHRWHAPVSGKITGIKNIRGGFNPMVYLGKDAAGSSTDSQTGAGSDYPGLKGVRGAWNPMSSLPQDAIPSGKSQKEAESDYPGLKGVVRGGWNPMSNLPQDAIPPSASALTYAAHEATRTLIFIDNKKLGTVACVFGGIMERSSCEPTVSVGVDVSKGDQLGLFHFGGSTHCLIFRPEIKLSWTAGDDVKVNQKLLSLPPPASVQ
ncbi:uncharacterized protein BO97DRAFT_402015 [Aspergillus homomorphus CBS 101889]|uniref:L-tryptophan decarboxylase PsiD-like domain-containing protein n=1 Tax=Aspergillus homomorphus (strain CBS 101889) TaxID=1450537 RepID=A0A395IB04_ASPHC|nr:hypothetical protein BO97DRAFT_402015 [Aspergillus homomorphus CBS 101889]RAL17402.1 hypothetical protein BO97DRAFT_402015 [Aspergillus homomorphus CBS 101889]